MQTARSCFEIFESIEGETRTGRPKKVTLSRNARLAKEREREKGSGLSLSLRREPVVI